MKTKRIKIKDVKSGMKIKTRDADGNIVFKSILNVFESIVETQNQVKLYFLNGIIINCSTNHPIICFENGTMVEKLPRDLSYIDNILTDKGFSKLEKIEFNQNNDINYIDITVDETHTFFTSNKLDGEMILTHNSQGGIRGAAASCYYPYFHYEFENLIVLKNNKGVEDNRVRQMDYAVQFNRLFFKRLLEEKNITLFSPHEVPDLMDAFYSGNNDKFEELYVKYESSKKIKMKKVISAFDMVQLFLDERINTGRIYAQFMDHSNTHGSFDSDKHPITSSNLCTEICLPSRPFEFLDDPSGEISLCTLSAINFGNINKPEDFEKPCDLAVRALDELLTYQDYPMIQAQLSTERFRPLGVGIINLAYFLAKNNLKYDESALPMVDEYMEAMTYYLIKASNQLAKEKGACKLSHETKYGQGILPYDTAKVEVNELNLLNLKQDWKSLRKDLLEYGIRNATVFAAMPAESSCQLSNATNGVEPPRGYVSEKASKDGVLKQVVPEYHRLKNRYHLLWDHQSPDGYIKIMAIINRWADQSISTNISYNPKFYNGKIPLGELIKHFVMCYRYGLKTLYYSNVYDGASDSHKEEKTESKEQEIQIQELPESECDACVL